MQRVGASVVVFLTREVLIDFARCLRGSGESVSKYVTACSCVQLIPCPTVTLTVTIIFSFL